CPCGTGKKYKKCCGRPALPRRSMPRANQWAGKLVLRWENLTAEHLSPERLLVPQEKRGLVAAAMKNAGVAEERVQAFLQTGAFAISDHVPYPDAIAASWDAALRRAQHQN